ncbi:hypothetical protein LCGC14_0249510 [marine sediment metagenome]|uniref:DUF5672 domain-containing protein n=1 Tax=marine sediment metagenome TaxID=412755 RepID=A0A0F9X9U6_9ZZZZ
MVDTDGKVIPDFTIVLGVDRKHLFQLEHTFPTWKRHKPSMLERPMIVFYDHEQLDPSDVRKVIDHHDMIMIPWPLAGVEYEGGNDKFTNARRYRMLSGFVHVPAKVVKTLWWLKIDTDAIAHGMDDWIDSSWWADDPIIISPGWPYTKPPNQMVLLDEWVEREKDKLIDFYERTEPLDMFPKPGSDRLPHKRIGTWCAFFKTSFTQYASMLAEQTCGLGKLPVPSQDSYLWYLATRMGRGIRRENMKKRGWVLFATMPNIKRSAAEAMANG